MASDDIAKLGFLVDTNGLTKGEKALDKFAQTGGKTEKKVSSLDKQVKSFGTNASSAMASLTGPLGGIASRISAITTVATAGSLAMTAFAVSVTGAAAAIAKGVSELDDLQVALAKSEALIKVTGFSAGRTGEQLAQQAQDIAHATLASVEGIGRAQAVMLTFKSVSLDVFDDAIMLSQDMASVMGGDASTQALRLGKALNAPVQGMGALAIAGFKFTEQQKSNVKAFEESGQMLKAQAVILDEIKGQLSGVAAEISSKTLSGSLDEIGQNFDNLTVRLATNIGALDTFKEIVDRMSRGMRKTIEQLKPDTAAQAADKAMNLLWEIADVEAEIEKTMDLQTKNRLRITVASLTAQRGEFLKYAKDVSEVENKLITARGDALLKSIELNKQAAAAAKKAAAAKTAAEAAKEYDKWRQKVEGFLTPAQKMQAEIKRINEGLLSGDLTETAGLANYLSITEGKLRKLNETAQDNSFEDLIESISSGTKIGQLKELQNEIDIIQELMNFDGIDEDIGKQAIDGIKDRIKGLKDTVDDVDIFGGVTDSINKALSAVQKLSKEGSKDYRHLGKAIEAVTLAQQFQATQEKINAAFEASASAAKITASGAEAQAAAAASASMAASLAAATAGLSLVVSAVSLLGSLGGEIETTFAANQASQGLNVWGDKADSIANSIDITADATDKLVGINTGMLRALQSLQAGISGAAGLSARGVAATDFNFQANVSGGLLGGKSKVTDQGIEILGGIMSELIDDTMVMAYQEVKSRKHVWSSSKTNVETQLIDDASDQFALVFDSLADTVFEAGSALGMNSAQLEKSINEFEIATTKISLKDLGIEEQQAEIEAVFSKIFDDLAADVIPFASDFQKAGEGIGETLTRLATEVSIAEFAVKNLGIELGDKLANPQMFTQISDNLTNLTGGIESFASKTASFVDDFAPETVKFAMNSDAITEQLAAVNLAVPESADAFYQLMTTLDGTTSAGQQQIAALLNVQDVAGDYYDLLEDRSDKAASKLADEVAAQAKAQSELDSFNSSLLSLSDNLRGAIVGIYGTEVATSKLSLTAALESARLGDFSKALDLNLSNLSPTMEGFESLEAFNIEQAITANKLAELADLTAGQATTEDMMLTNSNDQVMLLSSINDNLSSAYVPQQTQVQNNDSIIIELRAANKRIIELTEETNNLMRNQNKLQADSADSLDRIVNVGVEIVA